MFLDRNDYIAGLIGLYQRLDPSNINALINNPTPVADDIKTIRNLLNTKIKSFITLMIEGLLEMDQPFDSQFADICIEFDPILFGEILANAISKFYSKIGFDALIKIIDQIKNIIPAIDGIEALFKHIIVEGEKHRDEACDLTKRLNDISSSKDFERLSANQAFRVTRMIERLKPHARPVVRKMFYLNGMTLKKGEENGVSYPVLSKQGSWAEHDLLLSVFKQQYEEKGQNYKKILKK